MTPKDQAHKLIVRFYYKLPNNGSSDGLLSTTNRWKEGTNCAILFVTIMIEEYETFDNGNKERIQYWEEVKLELNKHLDESERKR